jgi:hypothetical protein
MHSEMNNSLLLSHPKIEDILITVKNMKLDGKTVLSISHELSRNFQPPNPKITAWQTCFVLQCLEILRKRGDLPPNVLKVGKTGRTFYYEVLEKIVEERAKV